MNHAEPPGRAALAGGGTLGARGPARRAGGARQPERTVPCSRPGSPCLPDGQTDRQTDGWRQRSPQSPGMMDGTLPALTKPPASPGTGRRRQQAARRLQRGNHRQRPGCPLFTPPSPARPLLSGVSPHTSRLSPGAPREPCSVPLPAPWELGAGQAGAPGRCCRHRFSRCRNICSACHFFSLL